MDFKQLNLSKFKSKRGSLQPDCRIFHEVLIIFAILSQRKQAKTAACAIIYFIKFNLALSQIYFRKGTKRLIKFCRRLVKTEKQPKSS